MNKKFLGFLALVILLAIVGVGSFMLWSRRHDIQRELEKATLPEAVEYQVSPSPTSAPRSQAQTPINRTTPTPQTPVSLPAEVNLAVPFTPQAPHANWEDPYGDYCEEASVLMAMSYITKETIASPDDADQKMRAIQAFEDQTFGYSKDTNVEETARIIREYYKFSNVQVVANPTTQDIKQAVASGKVVIVPAAGRNLGNPYFQQPGPLYHMFVIKGYTSNGKFITNDPGTRRGADFLYDESVVMNVMHDWRPDGQIELGRKAVIIVG